MTQTSDKPSQSDLLAKAHRPATEALRLHSLYKGKIQVLPKCPVRDLSDFSIWYSPGVAAPCKAIHANPDLVYEYTNKGNTVAVISDGTRVLGLGNIGPEAGLPVMEGKALLFKYLGGVDAIPLCLRTENPDEFVRTVTLLEPSFGAINLEDIAQPKCFGILEALRAQLRIPVWHDDQQGTAVVALAGLLNALSLVGKDLVRVKLALIGVGAANVAVYRLLKMAGVPPINILACDSRGLLHRNRHDIAGQQDRFADKWRICSETNVGCVEGGIAEALKRADVCLAFSKPDPQTIQPQWIRAMGRDAIVFACANPTPEIWPWEAKEAGARIVASGRGDFPNQVNNSLCFPAIFRGVLDVRARAITDEMALVAAGELASFARERGIDADNILPKMNEWEVYPRIAVASAMQAQRQGVAKLPLSREALYERARSMILSARESVHALMREGLIPAPAGESQRSSGQ